MIFRSLPLAFVLVSAAFVPTARQDVIDQTLKDGIYTGSVHIHGGFTFPLQDVGSALFTAAIDGEAEMEVIDGTVTGSWTYVGTGAGGFEGGGVSATSDSVYDGSGTFTGIESAARIVGTNNVASSTTFFGTTSTSSDSQPIDEAITNVLAGCGQVVGTFSLRVNQEIEAQLPGAASFINGTVALYSDPPTDEVVELAQQVSQLRAAQIEDPKDRVLQAINLLADVESLQAELNAASSCPATKEYFNILTNVAADLVADVLSALDERAVDQPLDTAELSANVLPGVMRLGISTGATGAGAVDGRGSELFETARTVAQSSVDELIAASNIGVEVMQLAGLSVQMHWDLKFGLLTDRVAWITLGGGS